MQRVKIKKSFPIFNNCKFQNEAKYKNFFAKDKGKGKEKEKEGGGRKEEKRKK